MSQCEIVSLLRLKLLSETVRVNPREWLTSGTCVEESEKLVHGGITVLIQPLAPAAAQKSLLWLLWLVWHQRVILFHISDLSALLFTACMLEEEASSGWYMHPVVSWLHTILGWSGRTALPDVHVEIMACMNMSLNGIYLRRCIRWMMRIYLRLCHFALTNKMQCAQKVV